MGIDGSAQLEALSVGSSLHCKAAWGSLCQGQPRCKGWAGHMLQAAMAAPTETMWGMASPRFSQSALGTKIRWCAISWWCHAGESNCDVACAYILDECWHWWHCASTLCSARNDASTFLACCNLGLHIAKPYSELTPVMYSGCVEWWWGGRSRRCLSLLSAVPLLPWYNVSR